MTVTAATFRTTFPAFGDIVKYPDSMVGMWLSVAVKLVNAARWGTLTDFGVMLYSAHNLALEAQATAAGAHGRVPGGQVGVLSSKGADGLSAGYDVSSVTEQGAGYFNQTTYGTRFYRLSKMMGAGPLQIGTTDPAQASVAAWAGPIYPPA